ncbi:uncharacterized protein LOC123561201 [Mercenaria mercenaria]|uniref:uncharacterized protein LOC123561201 n=1 Tax=Mercenaria mercenaria TaxID=6596 RepID=UPI00234ED4E3|nr:uncharacterized protein LOC123561201 [Mercenaria mercenaria]
MASTIDATSFCVTHLADINTCVETEIQACSANSNITKFFGDGTALSAAYSYLCTQFVSNSYLEPFGCAVFVDTGSVKGNLTDFDISVDALSDPTLTEICSFADTMVNSFLNELSSVCSGSSISISIWSNYLSRFTGGCNGADTTVASTMLLLLSACLLRFLKF